MFATINDTEKSIFEDIFSLPSCSSAWLLTFQIISQDRVSEVELLIKMINTQSS